MRLAYLLLAIGAFYTAPALAQPPSGERAYIAGEYLQAATEAEADRSAQGHAFAARALMAACMTTSDRSSIDALLDRVERAAREALRLDPNSVEARLQWALALGVRGRRVSLAEAVARGYAPRGRRLVEDALAREPASAWGHALLGAWHLEVLQRGGRAGAVGYHANLDTGIAELERARVLAPHEPMIALLFAVSLIELDAHRYSSRAAALLQDASSATPRDAFETQMMRRSRNLALILARDGPDAADRAARRVLL